jgi:hypothetical protein
MRIIGGAIACGRDGYDYNFDRLDIAGYIIHKTCGLERSKQEEQVFYCRMGPAFKSLASSGSH